MHTIMPRTCSKNSTVSGRIPTESLRAGSRAVSASGAAPVPAGAGAAASATGEDRVLLGGGGDGGGGGGDGDSGSAMLAPMRQSLCALQLPEHEPTVTPRPAPWWLLNMTWSLCAVLTAA